MRKLAGAAMLAAALAAGGAFAETKPRSFQDDARIRQYTYSEHQVYRLNVYMRYITALQFAPGEQVESVQVGDSASWEIVRLKRGDVLSIKPLIRGAFTNMTVYTDRRVYSFELRALNARAGSRRPSYRISFRYPDEERREAAQAAARANRPRNSDYYVAGEAPFRPVAVYDDGVATYFTFPPNVARPAIFRVDQMGHESIVNVRQTSRGAMIDSVSPRWTIRIGDQELCVAQGRVVNTIRNGASAKLVSGGFRND